MANEPGRILIPQDPEVIAGKELRRLRLQAGWSQDEVARRMAPLGYEWNQGLVSKIEAAQRPLRVRELVDLATMFGTRIEALVTPFPGAPVRMENLDEEIRWMEDDQAAAEASLLAAESRLDGLHGELEAAQRAVLDARARLGQITAGLTIMREMRDAAADQADYELPEDAQ